ncbi:uncharacterized protein Hand isoform X2 [Bactrocera oleae]|uniref:uncharacterized protein Hand isoform X2 n=1 Tax=Bactrocera oleae TaxID=104688 RepID=UPI00174B7DCA|nr:uncharacterized protein LOC106617254 isoform X2 [Bactrocera oleae]
MMARYDSQICRDSPNCYNNENIYFNDLRLNDVSIIEQQWSASYCSDSSNNPGCYISNACSGANLTSNSFYRSSQCCSESSPKFDETGKDFHEILLTPTSTKEVTAVPAVRIIKKRNTANKKERRRTQSINNAFTCLREKIPNVPSDTKLSKDQQNYGIKLIDANTRMCMCIRNYNAVHYYSSRFVLKYPLERGKPLLLISTTIYMRVYTIQKLFT